MAPRFLRPTVSILIIVFFICLTALNSTEKRIRGMPHDYNQMQGNEAVLPPNPQDDATQLRRLMLPLIHDEERSDSTIHEITHPEEDQHRLLVPHNHLRHEDVMEEEKRQHPSSRNLVKGQAAYRVAVFGSSNAWGAQLENRYYAYPYLISPEVHNFAFYSAGPNYPSVCVNSMVGDDEDFDVIILDYWLKADQGLEQLAQRLRARFPEAIMIFAKLWYLQVFRRQPFRGSSDEMNIVQWKATLGLQDADYETIKAALIADDGYWYFPNHEDANIAFDNAMTSVGGVKFEFPMRATAIQTMIEYLGYFDEKHHQHVTPACHSQIAQSMMEIIRVQPIDFVHEQAVGKWGAGDSCHLWFTTGGTPYKFSPNWNMTMYDEVRGKYAIHVEEEGWMDIENNFDQRRTLFLSFMATDETWYPRVLLEFEGADGPVSVELNPATGKDKFQAHITKTVPVGKIRPGRTRITLKPIEVMMLPFRFVGASLTDEVTLPLAYGFGPQFAA